jgi:hypothetical protein
MKNFFSIENLKRCGINAVLLVIVLALSWFLSYFFGKFALWVLNERVGSWMDFTAIGGLPLSFIFFALLIFEAFGQKGKYWWVGLCALVATWLVYNFNYGLYWLLYVVLGILGWLVGLGIQKLIAKLKK